MVQTLERKSKFGYEPKDEIQIDEMRNPEAIREVIEEVQETKEERLVDLGKMQVYRVMWNDRWEAVQITLVRPIGSYAVPNEDGDADEL